MEEAEKAFVFSELQVGPSPQGRWATALRSGARFLAIGIVAAAGIALVVLCFRDPEPFSILVAVYLTLLVTWLATEGRFFNAVEAVARFFCRLPSCTVALALLLMAPLVWLVAQPAGLRRQSRLGAQGVVYREWTFTSRSRLARRWPMLARWPAATGVISGRIRLRGPLPPDPVEVLRWPFHLDRFDQVPGLMPSRRQRERIGQAGAAVPSLVIAAMSRTLPEGAAARQLLARPGGGPESVPVHPLLITTGELPFFAEELAASGYRSVLHGPADRPAELIAAAYQLWRHDPARLAVQQEHVA